MESFYVSSIPRRKITSYGQGARLASSPSEEYPYFSKTSISDKGRTRRILLIRGSFTEEQEYATHCPYHVPVIGSCSPDLILGVKNPLHLDKWTRTEKVDVVTHKAKGASGGNFKELPMLEASHHNKDKDVSIFPTLGRRIYERQTCWSSFHSTGDFSPVAKYWEWTELVLGKSKEVLEKSGIYNAVLASLFAYDRSRLVVYAFCESWCPATNSLHTSKGEISISLWDLKELGGLPITGEFYDEVTPSYEEITGFDDSHEPVLPFSCRFLFYAYHLIRRQDPESTHSSRHRVRVSSWVDWWFRGDMQYDNPFHSSNAPRNNQQRREYHVPSGSFISRERTEEEEEPFDDLGVDSDNRDEVHLAALLATWLCVFALPSNRGDYIRPETFKVASLMATGIRFSLAIPVLASIYNGLNRIATCEEGPGACSAVLPWHYVYAWMGAYFNLYHVSTKVPSTPYMCRHGGRFNHKTYDATSSREIFQQLTGVIWQPLRLKFTDTVTLTDSPNHHVRQEELEYIVSVRSCYLTLRRGSFYLVEPYSPHRFSRQFGYCQDHPGTLTKDIRTSTLRELVWHWRNSVTTGSNCEVLVPRWLTMHDRLYASTRFVKWWDKITHDYFSCSVSVLQESHRGGFMLASPNRWKGKQRELPCPLIEGASSEAGGIEDNITEMSSNSDPAAPLVTSIPKPQRSKIVVAIAENSKKRGTPSHDTDPSDLDSDRCNPRRQKRGDKPPSLKRKKDVDVGQDSDKPSSLPNKKLKSKEKPTFPSKNKERPPIHSRHKEKSLAPVEENRIVPHMTGQRVLCTTRSRTIRLKVKPKVKEGESDLPIAVACSEDDNVPLSDVLKKKRDHADNPLGSYLPSSRIEPLASELSVGDMGQLRREVIKIMDGGHPVVLTNSSTNDQTEKDQGETSSRVGLEANLLAEDTGDHDPIMGSYKEVPTIQPLRCEKGDQLTGLTPAIAVSTFCPGRTRSSCASVAITAMGETFLSKLKETPFDYVDQVAGDAPEVYAYIKALQGDPMSLKQIVDSYVADVQAYLKLESSLTGRMSSEDWTRKKVEADNKLELTISKLSSAQLLHDNCMKDLMSTKEERLALEEKICSFKNKEKDLAEELTVKATVVNTITDEVESAKRAVRDLESTSTVSVGEDKASKDLKDLLISHRDSLNPSKWTDDLL